MLRAAAAAVFLGSMLASGCYEVRPVVGGDDSRCASVVESLHDELYALPQGCTAVMEYSAALALQRWALVCASEPSTAIDELQARRFTECCEETGTAVNRMNPTDAFVFFDADEAGNGNVAVVSRHTATRVLEARLSGGEPNIAFPRSDAWRQPDGLAIDCNAETIVDVTSYDDDGDAPPVLVLELLESVGRTGVPDAMRRGDGELLWTLVVRTGAGDSDNGGWAVLLQSSSLGIDFR
jgi:hypothetical protein